MRFMLTHDNWVYLFAGDEPVAKVTLYTFGRTFGLKAANELVRNLR